MKKEADVRILTVFSIAFSISFSMAFSLFFMVLLTLAISAISLPYALALDGCCDAVCKQTDEMECYAGFHPGMDCFSLDECNIGCCIDAEGYCYGNYLKANCQRQGYIFDAQKECTYNPVCILSPPADSYRGQTGYAQVFESGRFGTLEIEPKTGTIGQPFTIRARLFGMDKKMPVVRAKISSGDFQAEIGLYDDGQHNDNNAGDSLYAGLWNSNLIPQTQGSRQVSVSIAVDGETDDHAKDFLVSSGRCLPLESDGNHDFSDTSTDIVFISKAAPGQGHFTALDDAVYLMELIKAGQGSMIGGMTENPEADAAHVEETDAPEGRPGDTAEGRYSYYVVTTVLAQDATPGAARYVAENECSFYKANQDRIVFIDSAAPRCQRQSDMIHTIPGVVRGPQAGKDEALEIDSFCDSIMTYEEYMQSLFPTGPQIVIINPKAAASFMQNDITINFKATHRSCQEISYEIFMDSLSDEMIIGRGQAASGVAVQKTLSIPDGKHRLWIEGSCADGPSGYSDVISMDVNAQDFVMTLLLPDSYSHQTSPDISFVMTHRTDTQINYKITDRATADSKAAAGEATDIAGQEDVGEGDLADQDLGLENADVQNAGQDVASQEIAGQDAVISQGVAQPGVPVTVHTSLAQGKHMLRIYATDCTGMTTTSWPIWLEIGSTQ